MTIDEYKDLLLEDEINIGYDVEEDDLPEEIEESSYVDELLTDGFHAIYDPLDESIKYREGEYSEEIDIFEVFGKANKIEFPIYPTSQHSLEQENCLSSSIKRGFLHTGQIKSPTNHRSLILLCPLEF